MANLKAMRAMAVLGVVLGLVLQPITVARGDTPNDPKFDQQWGLEIVGAPDAWEKTIGEGVRIAVIDSGIDLAHEDIADGLGAHVSCIGADDDPDACTGSGQDDHGHGTHVAGIAAAATGNGVGVASVAPGATLMSVKVLEPNSAGQATGSLRDIRAGIRWAVDRGADVINLSLGENVIVRNLFGSGLQDAIEEAWEAGVVPVIAAGNSDGLFGSGYGGLPALVVAATTRDDEIASYSTDVGDARWGIAAPGGDARGGDTTREILSTHWSKLSPYAWMSGTSMAAPHVSGAAAMLLSRGFTPRQTVDRLLETAADLGAEGHDRDFGHGRLDLAAATADLSPRSGFSGTSTTTTSPPPPPLPPPTTPPTVAAQQATPSTEPPPTPTTVAPSTTTTTTTPPENTAAVAAPVPGPPSDDGVGAWGVIAATALGLAALGARGVWWRRTAAVGLRRA